MQEEKRRAIGMRLREARRAADLTQQDVATDFLRSRQAVSAWEAGRTLPDLLEFRELACLYGVSADRLLYGVDDVQTLSQRLLARVRSAPREVESGFGDEP